MEQRPSNRPASAAGAGNLYRAPQSNFERTRAGSSNLPTDMFAQLASAGIWARYIAVLIFIFFFFSLFGIFSAAFTGFNHSAGLGIMAIITMSVVSCIIFLLGNAMNRYAKTAKRIKQGEMTEETAEACFSASTRFIKIQAILLLVYVGVVILGIAAAAAILGLTSR